MEYSVVTTSDKSYYPHLKILVNSILDKCDFKYLKNIYIIDNGLTEYQKDYFLDKSDIIKINTTGLQTNFSGGTWGDDWQKNVKGKTVHLYNMVNELKEPLLMLDADMLIIQDLHTLLDKGGDMQVCVRPGNPVKYIGSYFFSINHEKTKSFVHDWMDLTQSKVGKGAHESPSLTECVDWYLKNTDLNIVEMEQDAVDRYYPPPTEETVIVHFKGSKLYETFDEQYNARITNLKWTTYVEGYLD